MWNVRTLGMYVFRHSTRIPRQFSRLPSSYYFHQVSVRTMTVVFDVSLGKTLQRATPLAGACFMTGRIVLLVFGTGILSLVSQ